MITICFQIPEINRKPSTRQVCRIRDDCTIEELFQQAKNVSSDCPVSSLKYGFPPRVLQVDDNNKSQKVIETGISNHERIVIVLESDSDSATKPTATKTKPIKAGAKICDVVPCEKSSESSGRPRRKAAEKATESFPEAIKLIKRDTKAAKDDAKKAQKAKRPMTTHTKEKLATIRHFRKLESQQSPGTARRLMDGAACVSPSSKYQNKRPRIPTAVGTANTMEESLLLSVSGKAKGARLLRQNWKEAVNSAYEQNQAVARIAAIQAKTVTFETRSVPNGNIEDSTIEHIHTASLYVKYPKGVQGRGNYEETEPLMTLTLTKAVFCEIFKNDSNPDALKPNKLALLSPRVLWNVQYHFQNRSNDESTPVATCDDIVLAALMWIHPSGDWNYINRRDRVLSAKAKENLRQKKAEAQDEVVDWNAAVVAITEVEKAMDAMYESNYASEDVDAEDIVGLTWRLQTPNELDLDELVECIQSSCDDVILEETSHQIAQSLVDRCSIHNWRELANAQAQHVFNDLANCEGSILVSTIESWIEYAQSKSIDEIIYEICDGNENAIEALRVGMNSGTPKDLALWATIVPELHAELVNYSVTVFEFDVPSQEDLQTWCWKSQIAIDQFEWLNCFATPIDLIPSTVP